MPSEQHHSLVDAMGRSRLIRQGPCHYHYARSEPSFFFRLSKYQEKVIKLIEEPLARPREASLSLNCKKRRERRRFLAGAAGVHSTSSAWPRTWNTAKHGSASEPPEHPSLDRRGTEERSWSG